MIQMKKLKTLLINNLLLLKYYELKLNHEGGDGKI